MESTIHFFMAGQLFVGNKESLFLIWVAITADVPQGSILGPLFILIYINDIIDVIHSHIRLFADDTSLYLIVDEPCIATMQLNSNLAKNHKTAEKWLVKFNPAKSEAIVISRKAIKLYHPPLRKNDQSIKEVTSNKHLGILFSNDGTRHEHIDYMTWVSKAWTRINLMRKLNSF